MPGIINTCHGAMRLYLYVRVRVLYNTRAMQHLGAAIISRINHIFFCRTDGRVTEVPYADFY